MQTILDAGVYDEDGIIVTHEEAENTALVTITSDPIPSVPEPSTIFLLSAGLMSLGVLRRRQN